MIVMIEARFSLNTHFSSLQIIEAYSTFRSK